MNGRPSLWRRILNSLKAGPRGTPDTLDMTPDGFIFTRRGQPTAISWRDITRVDVATRDMLTLDVFYVVVYTAITSLMIDEFTDGFRQFEQRVFDLWPQIRERWVAIYAGPQSVPRSETLWRR